MTIHDYVTSGGKDLIKEGYRIRHNIILYGLDALKEINTRQLKSKLWEIKFSKNRIMYILKDEENIYFLHACRKKKGKAEKFELEKAISRAKEAGIII